MALYECARQASLVAICFRFPHRIIESKKIVFNYTRIYVDITTALMDLDALGSTGFRELGYTNLVLQALHIS